MKITVMARKYYKITIPVEGEYRCPYGTHLELTVDVDVPDNSLDSPRELKDLLKAYHTFLEDTINEQIRDRRELAKSKIPKGPDGRPLEWSPGLRKYLSPHSTISEDPNTFRGI